MHDLKIGIIGLGSIGLRHVNELLSLGVRQIYALRTNKGSKEISRDLIGNIQFLTDPDDFLNLDLDGYIIANPTSMHMETVVYLQQRNKPMFVEKPFCNQLKDIDLLIGVDHGLFQVGFCLRFLNVIQKVKELIHQGNYGTVHHSRMNVGQYLPSWHPYTDYRNEYYAQKKLGGGVLRTLSHELDLALYFFGKPDSFRTLTSKTSDLEIDTDDYALVLLNYKNQLCRVEMDFLSKKKYRNGIIYCTDADIHYDVFSNLIEIYDTNGKLVETLEVEQNNMYHDQMLAFLDFVTTQKLNAVAASLMDSIELMKFITDEKPI